MIVVVAMGVYYPFCTPKIHNGNATALFEAEIVFENGIFSFGLFRESRVWKLPLSKTGLVVSQILGSSHGRPFIPRIAFVVPS